MTIFSNLLPLLPINNSSNHSLVYFAAQYSLGAPSFSAEKNSIIATNTAVEEAIKDGSKWVLKPQREGGGNNLYGDELSDFLMKNENDPILSGTFN